MSGWIIASTGENNEILNDVDLMHGMNAMEMIEPAVPTIDPHVTETGDNHVIVTNELLRPGEEEMTAVDETTETGLVDEIDHEIEPAIADLGPAVVNVIEKGVDEVTPTTEQIQKNLRSQ